MSGPIKYTPIHEMPVGVPFEVWGRGGKRVTITRFKSDGRPNNYGKRMIALEGDYARMWITDPCTMAVEESIHAARMNETEQQRLDRIARRRARDKLNAEAVTAKSQPARRRAW
jgi:hypothetical protein